MKQVGPLRPAPAAPAESDAIRLRRDFETLHRRPRPGRTLIVGSRVYAEKPDRRALYGDVLGVDMLPGPGVDQVLDLEEDPPAGLGQFAHVECLSVLEHSRRPWLMAANIERLMMPGATLDLSAPFAWSLHAYPSDYYRFSTEGVRALFGAIEWQALLYAHECLVDGGKTPRKALAGHIYIARTEVFGWGVRR